jgi:hypothetical protein
MSRDSVRRAVKTLLQCHLIGRRRRKSPDGDPAPNLYFLLGVGAHSTHLSADSTQGRGSEHPGVGATAAPNKTQLEPNSKNKSEAEFIALQMNGAYGLCATCQTWHQPGPCP